MQLHILYTWHVNFSVVVTSIHKRPIAVLLIRSKRSEQREKREGDSFLRYACI
jgi:hypothetical protein